MANPSFPAGLPVPLLEGISYSTDTDHILRSQFAGGLKMRRRQTSAPEVVQFSLLLTRAQLQVLHAFVVLTLGDVLPFEWVEFRDPARGAATYRFRARPRYQVKATGKLWQADIELDLLTPFSGVFNLGAAAGALITNDGEGLTS